MSFTPEQIQAIALVIDLARKRPPNDESWDTAELHGPHLHNRLREWLREKL